jgi:hypothetical protein
MECYATGKPNNDRTNEKTNHAAGQISTDAAAHNRPIA